MKVSAPVNHQETAPISLFEAFAFHYRDITIDGYIRKCLNAATGQRPADFEYFDLRPRSQPQDYARIVRREKASPACLQTGSPYVARLPGDARSYGIGITVPSQQV
jgi:hypothetical protein